METSFIQAGFVLYFLRMRKKMEEENTMKTKRHLWVITALALALVSFGYPQQSAEQLYQAGLYAEEVEGELQKAIGIYTQVVEKFAGEKEIAADAQLHIGLCYEKLGREEAIKAYEQVLKNYAGQDRQVAEARARLARLRKEQPQGLSMTRILPTGVFLECLDLSPDGMKVTGIDMSIGQNVAVYDLASEKKTLITSFEWGIKSDVTYIPVWSPTGEEIAFQAFTLGPTGKEPGLELRTATLSGKSRVLYKNTQGGLAPCDWLDDGTALVTFLGKKGGMTSMGLVSTIDGSFQELCPIKRNYTFMNPSQREASASADASPDGRFIVFADGPAGGSRDIFVVPVAGGSPVLLTDHGADDKEPRWSPDGRHIVFLSLRHGNWALWGIAVDDGKPSGQPFMILEGMQNARLSAWSKNGLFSSTVAVIHDVWTLDIDPVNHEVRGKPQMVEFSPYGSNINPVWSPEGRHLAFISNSADQTNEASVVVMTSEGGNVRKFKIPTESFKINSFRDLRWLPDGSGLGFSHWENQMKYSLFRLSLKTEEWTLSPLPVNFSSIEWAGDGNAFFYIKFVGGVTSSGIAKRDLESGEESYLVRFEKDDPFYWSTLKASRDHKWLTTAMRHRIDVIDVETGETQSLSGEEDNLGAPTWSPDGKYLVASCGRDEKTGTPTDLVIVSREDGKQKFLEVGRYLYANARIMTPDWSPDGRKIAFATRLFKTEANLIKNVIPEK
jgi:Tol biopolymer transport system component